MQQQHKHFTLFNPDANFDFVGRRRFFYALTGIGMLVSLVSLSTIGFNKGIDFKGGTKLIVSFTNEAQVTRVGLRADMEKALTAALGHEAGQVEVQEFDTGSGGSRDRQHFVVVTEVTSLVAKKAKDTLKKQIITAFGPNTMVNWAAEGEDRADIQLAEKKPIPATYETLKKMFADAGFPQVTASSGVEQVLDNELYRQLEMSQTEEKKTQTQLATEEQNLRAAKVQKLQTENDMNYTVVVQEFRSKLENTVREKYGKAFIGVESSTSVSPSVAGDMLAQGLVAILYSLIGIVLYIVLRFDVRYAPGAFIALAHDVLLVIGAFSLAQVKFSMPVIAAVLTVAGYSITDTIVVFDRIRENQKQFPGVPIETVINAAINSTMSRTVLTSLTTMLVSGAIFLFGGGLIRDFAFAMVIGVIVGTFSSICIASPIYLFLHHRMEKKASVTPSSPAAARA
ncbi:MAG: protein translocase subunit SecF [Myxococcota bacterium]